MAVILKAVDYLLEHRKVKNVPLLLGIAASCCSFVIVFVLVILRCVRFVVVDVDVDVDRAVSYAAFCQKKRRVTHTMVPLL